MRIAMFVCVYYCLDHLFSRHGRGCSQKWELQCMYVYYSLDPLFSRHGGGWWEKLDFQYLYEYIIPLITNFPKLGGDCSQKWELQCMYMHNIPFITYFPNMEELLAAIRIAMYMCILFLWSHISPTWMGSSQKWEFHCLYVYIIPLITYFPKYEGGCSHKWELQSMYVYNIPLITYFANMAELLTEMRIAISVCVYYSLDHLFSRHGGGCWE